jgi:hypothetical protein
VVQLELLQDCYPGVTLEPLCFERDPADRHRSVLAGWLSERLGVEVPELGRPLVKGRSGRVQISPSDALVVDETAGQSVVWGPPPFR